MWAALLRIGLPSILAGGRLQSGAQRTDGHPECSCRFETSFRSNNIKAVKDTPVLPPERIRRAIATGVFEGAGRRIPCEKEAKEATNLLLNRIMDTYQRIAGGALSWDTMILTGGGIGLLYSRLKLS